MAQPLHHLREMGRESGEPEHDGNQCKPQGKAKYGGGLGDEKEETGSNQCEQPPEVQSSVEQGQERDLCALVFPHEDASSQLPNPPRSDQSQRTASQQSAQLLLQAEVAHRSHQAVPFISAEDNQRENAEDR